MSPGPSEKGPGGRRASAVLREAADWVELFDVNTMSIYYRNNLTGKTRKTMPVEMKFAKEKEKERLAAEAAAAVPVPPTLQQRLGAALVASGAALPDEASSSALAVLPVESTAGKSRAVSDARRYSAASLESAASKASERSRPSAFKSSRTNSKNAMVPQTQRSKMSEKQLAEREKNKHLLFKSFVFLNEFQVSNTGSRVSSTSFRDELLVVTSDFDGNCKFTIWKSSVLLSHLQSKRGLTTHLAGMWCLDAVRSKAYGDGTSDWITVSFSGDLIIWRDPIDTGAKLTSGVTKLPEVVQRIGPVGDPRDTPPAHALSHLCGTCTLRGDRVFLLVSTEAGHVLEYTLPESEVVPSGLVIQPMPGLEGYSLNATYIGLHYQLDNSGRPMTIPITALRYTPNEKYIVTAGLDGSIRVWTHLFKPVTAIPSIFEYKRFTLVQTDPRPQWKFGAVTALDISNDSKLIVAGYQRGGLVMVWDVLTAKAVMKIVSNPESSKGMTQADRVRESQRRAKQEAKALEEAKKKYRMSMDPSTVRRQSLAFTTGTGMTGRLGEEDGSGLDEAMTMASSRTGVSVGADGRTLNDPNSRFNAAYSDLSVSESDSEEDNLKTGRSDAVGSAIREEGGAAGAGKPGKKHGAGGAASAHPSGEDDMPRDSFGKYYSITGAKFSHDMKFIVVATSHAWLQLFSSKTGRLTCQLQLDADITCVNISPSDCFVAVGFVDGRVSVFEIQEQSILSKPSCAVM